MADGTGFTITRVFDAPRDRVWREWTEPERFADWYGGAAAEIPLDTVSMDVREGGTWRATMFFGPERREIRWEGDYLEVAAPERLVFTVTDQPGSEQRDRCTVELIDRNDGRTEMRFEQSGGGLTPDGYEAAKHGWGVFFDRMAEGLAAGA
jgi:uncharacterized protein YndB with AHSA1/START domain